MHGPASNNYASYCRLGCYVYKEAYRTWENFGVGKICEFGESWALRQYFTRQLEYSS